MVELLSGLSWSEQTSAKLAGRTGQLNLDQVISQINSAQQSQPYIDLDLSTDVSKIVIVFIDCFYNIFTKFKTFLSFVV